MPHQLHRRRLHERLLHGRRWFSHFADARWRISSLKDITGRKALRIQKLETASAADSHFQLGFLVQAPTVALVCALQAARLGILSPPCAQPTSYVYCPASALAQTWWIQWLTARWTPWAPEESYAGPPWVDKWQWCILVLRCSTSSKTWALPTIFKIMIAIRV